jgi:hypothetical protein
VIKLYIVIDFNKVLIDIGMYMNEINIRSLTIPRESLVREIIKANEIKREVIEERDKKYGDTRPMFGSYLENIALPELFSFDMNDYYRNPELSMEIDLRYKLFWLDNSHDDSLAELHVGCGTMYYDMTLFGIHIDYPWNGVPHFLPHEMNKALDLSLLKPFDFYTTGEMPLVLNRYNDLKNISKTKENGEIHVDFPSFHRGPLDIAVQLRGYENFITDCMDDPDSVHGLISYIVSERKRFNEIAKDYKEKTNRKPESFIADDWVNIPFITPDIFDEFAVPAYREIQENEGTVTGFHTCGVFTPVVESLLNTLKGIKNLEVSGWNDFLEIHERVSSHISLCLNFINSLVIVGKPEEHQAMFKKIGRIIADSRKITLNTQAIVKLSGTLYDSIIAMNRFIDTAREYFAAV